MMARINAVEAKILGVTLDCHETIGIQTEGRADCYVTVKATRLLGGKHGPVEMIA